MKLGHVVLYVVAAVVMGVTVFTGGLMMNPFVELVMVVLVLLLPLLKNRVQHIHFEGPPAAVVDLADVAPDARERTVRTLCYNLFMRPSLWFVRNNDSDHKNERLTAFIRKHLDAFDIICLQEMFGLLSFRQRRLLAEAEKRGFANAAVAGAPTYLFWDRHWSFKIPFLDAGLVILSRFPIVETDSHYYSLGNQIDGWAPKQVLWALVRLPGSDNFLHVFNTHMQASYYDAPSDASDLARAKQINEMAAFIKEKVYGRVARFPALILGDFNLDGRGKDGVHSLDYVRMMDVLTRELANEEDGYRVRDLLYEQSGIHPITYGDVRPDAPDQPQETVLTHMADHCCAISIDYALWLGPDQVDGMMRHVETHVEPFFCEPDEAGPCTQLSDHYGISSRFLL